MSLTWAQMQVHLAAADAALASAVAQSAAAAARPLAAGDSERRLQAAWARHLRYKVITATAWQRQVAAATTAAQLGNAHPLRETLPGADFGQMTIPRRPTGPSAA